MISKMWNADNGDGTYTNPILYADYSDPDAIRVGCDYYMVASNFCNTPGIPVLHSRNLVNWEVINYVLQELPDKRYEVPVHGCGVWAPSIRYHAGTYFVCFPMPDEGIYMSTTTNPYGKWSSPVPIRPGAGWIDPCPFWDEDGKAYLVAGVAKSRIGYKSVLYLQEMQPDGMGLVGEAVKIFDGNENDQNTIEGPKMYKRNGWYYIFAPAGGVKTGWQTVLRSREVYGPYEYKVVMRQGNSEVNGPHQGAWIDTVTGEDWFIHFQDVYAAGRILHLQPMVWKNDWPVIGAAGNGNDYGEPVSRYRKPDTGNHHDNIAEPATSDDFKNKVLGLQWQWNANSKKEWYTFTDNGLVLHAVKKEGAYGDVPNLLLQKWPAPEFSCVTKLDLSKLTPGDEAGVISMGMEYGLVSFLRDGEFLKVICVRGKQKFGNILVENTEEKSEEIEILPEGTKFVSVKYVVEHIGTRDIGPKEKNFPMEKVSILYSVDEITYQPALEMIAIPGRWVGVKNGIFCVSSKEGSKGSVTAESVLYSPGGCSED
ncbi:MAG: family 43 glycosylhydrolase [Lachnospiraceae bacterium]